MITEDFNCVSNFEKKKEIACHSLTNQDQYCLLVDNECREWYQNCEDYHPNEGFEDTICEKIIPSTLFKKCSMSNEGGSKTCVMIDQNCEDSSDKTCVGINRGEDKRCVFKSEGEKCEEHSNLCTGLTENECKKNIPLDSKKKCSWEGEECKEVNRKCDEYELFKDSNTDSYEELCAGLESEASKTCILIDNKECKEVYESCDSINDEVECEKVKPLTSNKHSYDPLSKCEWSGNQCSTKLRICSDYKKREEDTEEICEKLSSEATGKICSFNSEKNVCEEIYKDCSSYNNVEMSKRKAEECEAIYTGSPNYKCKLLTTGDSAFCNQV